MSVLGFVFALVGGYFGGRFGAMEGALLGIVLGYLFGALIDLHRRVAELAGELAALRRARPPGGVAAPAALHTPSPEPQPASAEQTATGLPTTPEAVSVGAPSEVAAPPAQTSVAQASAATLESERAVIERYRSPIDAWLDGAVARIKGFFTDGNVVARIGIVVLFFGVGFLIKYASERDLFPIELRLVAVALGALLMLVLGWRLRARRASYALLLQGGAVGVLYLTVFAAAKLYLLVPLALAFAVMVGLVVLSAALAVLQDAKVLAMFGAAGGFLAPVLTSTGGGNHVMLFSFYALLNAGILAIAWYRAWRELNLLGFLFTFIVGAAWGTQYYQPPFFPTVEPFLVLFFVFYVCIAVLFAVRQPPQLKGYVDGSIVFGVPLVAFGLQIGLVKDFHYGTALSAVALSVFYVLLATTLWRRAQQGLRLLTEAFLALAVVFATLAIPLALDGHWVASAWALEGAALVWVGVRQRRLLARLFGIAVQAAAGVALLGSAYLLAAGRPVFNAIFLGALLLAVAGFFSAYFLYRYREHLRRFEQRWHVLVMAWAVAWWLGDGLHEIHRFVASDYRLHAALGFLAATALAMNVLAPRWSWPLLRMPAIGLLPLAVVMLLLDGLAHYWGHPFARYGFIVWPIAAAVHFQILYRAEPWMPLRVLRAWHVMGLWWLLALLTWEAAWAIDHWVRGSATWAYIAWGMVPAVAILLLLRWTPRMRWPLTDYEQQYLGSGAALPVLYCWCWLAIASLTQAGVARPLVYLPILNPVDIASAFVLIALTRWHLRSRSWALPVPAAWVARAAAYGIGVGAFLWLNGMLARSVHHWANVPFTFNGLFYSMVFQATLSIAWTLAALSLMVFASRRGQRVVWIAGAALIGLVVFKLFTVDLSNTGTVARIVSFICVGILLLLVGYLSPLPPRSARGEASS